MSKTLIFILLSLSLNIVIKAQASYKSKLGIQTGNHITLWGEGENESFRQQALLRYSIGFLGRQILKENWRTDFFILPVRKADIALDYGINFVFKGYQYQFRELGTHTDQLTIELPLLFAFYDRKDVLIKKKLLRRGITSMSRIGVKPSFTTKGNLRKRVVKSDAALTESIDVRSFNLMLMIGVGMVQNQKNGNSSFVEISYNHGLIKRNTGTITYENLRTGGTQTEAFFHYGSYISVNVGYLFKGTRPRFLGKGKLPPRIYNPRF